MVDSRSPEAGAWNILIVDDEPEIHVLTRTVLKDVRYDGKPLRFISAYSGDHTREVLQKEKDIALVLMDVMMEEDQTGLDLVHHIRHDLDNHLTRIILRTGYPGEAPERRVIVEYEINDYKEKVDLTSHRLFTSVVKSLRNYRDLQLIEAMNQDLDRSRDRLTRVNDASARLFAVRSLDQFFGEFMDQASEMLGREKSALLTDSQFEMVLFATGNWSGTAGQAVSDIIPRERLRELRSVRNSADIHFIGNSLVCRLESTPDSGLCFIADGAEGIEEEQRSVLRLFFGNARIVYNNLALEAESLATQTEMIRLVGDVIENRDSELKLHVSRVSDYAVLLAEKIGLPEDEIEVLRNAVPLHDVGKIGIYDSILQKPGPLTPDEFESMKRHTTIGYEILRFSSHRLFRTAAIIAREHHERWDGKGYPRGLAGEDIDLLGRITCIVDVFDALTSDRVYRKAWPFEKTVNFIRDGRGVQFDPRLVDLFLEEPDRIREIMVRYAD